MRTTNKFQNLWLCHNEINHPGRIAVFHAEHPMCIISFSDEATSQEEFDASIEVKQIDSMDAAKLKDIISLMKEFVNAIYIKDHLPEGFDVY